MWPATRGAAAFWECHRQGCWHTALSISLTELFKVSLLIVTQHVEKEPAFTFCPPPHPRIRFVRLRSPASSAEADVIVFTPFSKNCKVNGSKGKSAWEGGVLCFTFFSSFFFFKRLNSVTVAANPPSVSPPPCQCHDPTVANLKPALDFLSFRRNNG